MVCIPRSGSQRRLKPFVVLLRDTTWKCGVVERLIVNYLRQQFQRCGCTRSSVKNMLEHFSDNSDKENQHHRFLDAIERLERRGIIKIVFKPFSSPDEVNALSEQGGL